MMTAGHRLRCRDEYVISLARNMTYDVSRGCDVLVYKGNLVTLHACVHVQALGNVHQI